MVSVDGLVMSWWSGAEASVLSDLSGSMLMLAHLDLDYNGGCKESLAVAGVSMYTAV